MVKVEALACDLENLARVEERGQRLAAEHAQRDAVVLVADHVVRPRRDGRDVGRYGRGGRELPAARVAVLGVGLRRHVRHHDPVRRGGHRELIGGFHVRLVKARVHPVGVERLQVRVQVHPPVGRVGEPVQPFPAARVGAVGHHPQHVAGRQRGQRDPVAVEGIQPDRLLVQGDLSHRGRGQVDEAGRAGRRAVEADHAHRPEDLLAGGQVEVHLVRGNGDERRAGRRLVAGQVRCHRLIPSSARGSRPGLSDVIAARGRAGACLGRRVIRPYLP